MLYTCRPPSLIASLANWDCCRRDDDSLKD
ncbi:unnamed protein product [Acanthoscelides obtectus]|uniref:Uncharacterized protein n=1 Tax=Acanthoscelides obtectus TaxID=200917 RepID=A0A9P0P3Y8_ACAOB|nr:unnamed protein product [Acanthoscelides obtectus]CAK1628771.1 hypothetical protein AOBTE_LOCUS5392 [Acanthoscelides obtectus]